METMSYIRAHLQRIPQETIFSTRDFLCYGPRAAVDTALHRLVKRDVIFRLARGVFIKWSKKIESGILPSAREVADVKARAFGKVILIHKVDAAAFFDLVEEGNENPTFGTFGRSTSFQYGQKRIKFTHVAPKDANCGDEFCGLVIRALRHFGFHEEIAKTFARVMAKASKAERRQLALAAAMMPSWLSDILVSDQVAILKIASLTKANAAA